MLKIYLLLIRDDSKDWRSEFILVADTAGLESTVSMWQASSAYNLIAHAKFITMSSSAQERVRVLK